MLSILYQLVKVWVPGTGDPLRMSLPRATPLGQSDAAHGLHTPGLPAALRTPAPIHTAATTPGTLQKVDRGIECLVRICA